MDGFAPEVLEVHAVITGYRRAADLANALLGGGWALMVEVAPLGADRRDEDDSWTVKAITMAGDADVVVRRLRQAGQGGDVTVRAVVADVDVFPGGRLSGPG